MPRTDTDTQTTVADQLGREHRDYSPGVNETAKGYVNPASLPEPTYTDEAAMLEARGATRDDDDQPQAQPNEDWLRADLEAHAAGLGIAHPDAFPNKAALLEAIEGAQGGGE